MTKLITASALAIAVCAGTVVASSVTANAQSIPDTRASQAQSKYSENDLFQFILNASGPIAADNPQLAQKAHIVNVNVSQQGIDKAEKAYEQVDPGIGGQLTSDLQSGDPYRVASVLERVNSDTQKIRTASKLRDGDASHTPSSPHDVTTNVNNVFNYNQEAISAVTTVFFVAEAVVAGVAVVFGPANPNGDLAHDQDVEALAQGLAA